jgi:RNA polymerase sigma-70 factor, ECF subfamily
MDGSNELMPELMADLVVAAQEGDRSAFDELVRLTYADTYTLAFRLTADPEDAGDVVQESYLRAYRGLKRFRGDAQFSTWLYRITSNCASTQLGRRARHRHDELDDEVVVDDLRPEANPEASLDSAVLRDRLQVALRSLPPRLRAVVVLRDVYDLPHEAIASELGISVSAAKVRLHRARRRLREQLYPMPGETVVSSRPTEAARGVAVGEAAADAATVHEATVLDATVDEGDARAV